MPAGRDSTAHAGCRTTEDSLDGPERGAYPGTDGRSFRIRPEDPRLLRILSGPRSPPEVISPLATSRMPGDRDDGDHTGVGTIVPEDPERGRRLRLYVGFIYLLIVGTAQRAELVSMQTRMPEVRFQEGQRLSHLVKLAPVL